MLTRDLETIRGRTWTYTASEPLERIQGRLYATSLGDDSRLYHDDGFAANSVHGGVILPPTLVFDTFQPFLGHLEDDGLFEASPAYLHGAIRAGNSYEFGAPARPGDILHLEVSIKELRQTKGRSGRLVFIETELKYANQDGVWLGTNVESLVLRLKEE